jgi:hypothetical protein
MSQQKQKSSTSQNQKNKKDEMAYRVLELEKQVDALNTALVSVAYELRLRGSKRMQTATPWQYKEFVRSTIHPLIRLGNEKIAILLNSEKEDKDE